MSVPNQASLAMKHEDPESQISRYRRPQKECFDTYYSYYEELSFECRQQWKQLDRECRKEWHFICDQSYDDLDVAYCIERGCQERSFDWLALGKNKTLRSKYQRPDKRCFDTFYDPKTEKEQARECDDQWWQFDDDCLDDWNTSCTESYNELERVYCRSHKCKYPGLMKNATLIK